MEASAKESIPEIPRETKLSEEYFFHYTTELSFEPGEVAFVMIDLWNTGFGPAPLSDLGWEAEYNCGKSFCDRAAEIEKTKILPMLEACRENGLTVVHAPTRDIALKYSQWETLATDPEKQAARSKGAAKVPGGRAESPTSATSDWPPSDWVKRWQLEHTFLYRTEEWITNYYAQVRPNQDIPAPLRPAGGDLVVSSGEMLHRLLRDRQVKVLFYCGFAANMCLADKSGAIKDMYSRGYMPIVIRDATAAVETAQTIDGLWATHVTIDQIEMKWGYSVTTHEFLEAVRSGGKLTLPCRYVRMHKPTE